MKIPVSSFDGIANKFDANIYGTSKGKLRHQLLLHFLSSYLSSPKMSVLDLGGGTGMMALEFAKQGHHVTVLDMSIDALDIAKQRLSAYSNTQFIMGEFEQHSAELVQLCGNRQFDFVICHAVLEWLSSPKLVLSQLPRLLSKNGRISLSFFNHDAKVFANLLYANFDYVKAGMPANNTVRLNPHNAQKPKEILAFLEQSNEYTILQTRGIRCFHDYIKDKAKIDSLYEQLFEMEVQYSAIEPYKWLAKYFHIMLEAR
jgi:S-adenosylmethionine-dependent methyltransferase